MSVLTIVRLQPSKVQQSRLAFVLLEFIGTMKANLKKFEKLIERLAPAGFKVSSLAPDTWTKTQASFATAGIVTVWNGASESTLYSKPAVNFAFRAWHDSIHLKHGNDFSLRGEELTADRQIEQAWNATTDKSLRQFCQDVLTFEIVEQARLAVYTGEFLENQLASGLQYLAMKGWK